MPDSFTSIKGCRHQMPSGFRDIVVGLVLLLVSIVVAAAEEVTLQVMTTTMVRTIDARPAIKVFLTPDSTELFAKFTQQHVGRSIEFRASDQVLMKARLMTPMLSGQLQLVTGLDQGEAENLAHRLISGDVVFTAKSLND